MSSLLPPFCFFSSVLFLLHLFKLFFSLKYAKYLEGYSIDGVRHVYKKACSTHLPRKPAIHLLWAAFEEQQGEFCLSNGMRIEPTQSTKETSVSLCGYHYITCDGACAYHLTVSCFPLPR